MKNKETGFSRWLRQKVNEAKASLALSSDAEFAQHAGVSKASLSRWLNGDIEPDYRSVRLLAPAIGLTPRKVIEAMGYIDPVSETYCDQDDLEWLKIWRSTPNYGKLRYHLRVATEHTRRMIEELAIYETDEDQE